MTKQDFLILVDKFLEGGASLQEEQQLINFYESFQNQELWDEKLLGVKADLEAKMLHRLMSTIQEEKPIQRRIWPNWTKYSIAASIVLISGLVLYLAGGSLPSSLNIFVSSTKKIDSGQYILPGENRASLILANGEKVYLNQSANDILAKQVGSGVKVVDGQLIYDVQTQTQTQTQIQAQAQANAGARNDVNQYNLIEVPTGGKFKVILPDGSQVWLNSESSLYYPLAFNGNERLVILTGEAYFDVAKQKQKPFKVKILHQAIEVLGTRFNVSAYKNDKNLKTTLIEGSVKVSIDQSKAVVLKPGEQSVTTINPQANAKLLTQNVAVDDAIAWMNGDFVFAQDHITDVMKKIERWYDVEVIYEGKIPNDKYFGMISKSKKLADVLYFLETAGNVEFKVDGRRIIVQH